MDIEVELFEAERGDVADLDHCYRVMVASQAIDEPDEPRLTYEEAVNRLRNPFPGLGPVVWWVARDRGVVVGVANAHFPEAENRHVAVVEVIVLPESRRQGIGTAVLSGILPELRARGRHVVEAWKVIDASAGTHWAASLGFQPVRAIAVQALAMAEADRSSWNIDVPGGYRVLRWKGSAPEEIVASYADARTAIHEAPVGHTEFQQPEWTSARVREEEADLRQQGVEQRVVVVVHEATGAVAGLTEVVLLPERPDRVYQGDTVVPGAHRGQGIGLYLKAEMAKWLWSDHPTIDRIQTSTSADNQHMIRVNREFGFTTVRTLIAMKRDLSALAAEIGDRPAARPVDPRPGSGSSPRR